MEGKEEEREKKGRNRRMDGKGEGVRSLYKSVGKMKTRQRRKMTPLLKKKGKHGIRIKRRK